MKSLTEQQRDPSVQELASSWGVQKATIYGLINAGKLAAYKVTPRNTRVKFSSIEELKNSEGIA